MLMTKDSSGKMIVEEATKKHEVTQDKESSDTEKQTSESGDSCHIQSFPAMLMKILELEEYADIITWLPDGKSMKILKPRKFTSLILPKHFTEAKYSSFKRKMHRWGFEHSRGQNGGEPTRFGSEETFQHENFQRDRWDLLQKITCQKHIRVRQRARSLSSASGSDIKEEVKADSPRSSSLVNGKKGQDPTRTIISKQNELLDPVLPTSASIQQHTQAPKMMANSLYSSPGGQLPPNSFNGNHYHRGSPSTMNGMARFQSQQMSYGMPVLPPSAPCSAAAGGLMDRIPVGGVYGSGTNMDMLIARRQAQERAYMAASSREQVWGNMYLDGNNSNAPPPPHPPPPNGGYPPFY
mmetsp:Transcript_27913/g.39243  ORF Transcript_27913/g.39243 Transcript_27913/m.39243 type:complete len:352 (+) Transcript_27913:74-1129(+)